MTRLLQKEKNRPFLWLEETKSGFGVSFPSSSMREGTKVGNPIRIGGRPGILLPAGRDSTGGLCVQLGNLVAADSSMLRAVWDACHYAPSDAPVLLTGESGVGKELLAQAIHDLSHRSSGPLVALNCAALPAGLVEAELFGHEQGAFTGARHGRAGLFEQADGGTLFLDEVGELAASVQAKLLRVLEGGEVRRVGASRTRSVSVRVISATHRNLAEEAHRHRFRFDLLFRLGVLPIEIPPLRQRPGDMQILCERLLSHLGFSHGLTSQAMERLAHHPWPGNVRELKNVLQRAVLRVEGNPIEEKHLLFDLPFLRGEEEAQGSLGARLDQAILCELERQGGHRKRTYEALRMPRSSFYRWLRRNRHRVHCPTRSRDMAESTQNSLLVNEDG